MKKEVEDLSEELREKLSDLKDLPNVGELRELAGDLAEGTATFVKKYPIQSVIGALAVGVFLGAVLGRRK